MDPSKQPDLLQRSKPQFRLGQEAVESAIASSSQKQKSFLEQVGVEIPGAVDKPMAECYPDIAEDSKERLVADVRRHWLGRLVIIITGAFLILFMLGFVLFLPSLTKGMDLNTNGQVKVLVSLVFIVIAALIGVGTIITLWIYNQNRMLITDENVVEVRQIGIFSHRVSHLNMINVEDVTVIKKGILQTLFDYGTMIIETAGEVENFAFPNTPNPDLYRRVVINLHEKTIEHIGKMGSAQRVEITNNNL